MGKGSVYIPPDCDELPTCVVCIETLGTYGGPASLPCGHNGCLECIRKVQKHSSLPLCPLCRTPFDADISLGPNLELKEALERAHIAGSSLLSGTTVSESCRTASCRKLVPSNGKPQLKDNSAWISKAANTYAGGIFPEDCRQYDIGFQEPPVLNVWNVFKGLCTVITGRRKTAPEILTDDDEWNTMFPQSHGSEEAVTNLWESTLIPSAPPMMTGPGDDVRSVRTILEAEPPQWIPDSAGSSCMQCAARFRPVTCGRHHCRFCGGIFCRNCSNGRCLLPVKFREREPKRVCDACYERLEPIQRILADRVSNASQVATHDVTDLSCMRSWLNSPFGMSMEQEIYKATNTIRNYANVGLLAPERSIPDAVLKGAKGLAILTVVKAGMMVTYKVGTGLVVARRPDGTWSAPSAIASVGLGWGAQVGGELTDFVIILRNSKAVKAFSGRLHFSLGAGLSAAAGPLGRLAEADIHAGVNGASACYTYSCSKGAFIGISLEGNLVMTRTDTNASFYGDAYVTTVDILSNLPSPIAAAPLYNALQDLFSKGN